MRYNPPLIRTHADAQTWVGKEVRDTYNRAGTVTLAWVEHDSVIGLRVVGDTGTFFTDSEHATQVTR